MLRFILALIIIIVIFTIAQENTYVGFGILLAFYFMFINYTINIVDRDDIIFERNLLKTPEGRHTYYNLVYT